MISTLFSNSTALPDSTSPVFPYWNIISTILIIVIGSGSIITLYYQDRVTKLRSIQNKLREDRRKFYLELLDPFLVLFSKLSASNRYDRIKDNELKQYQDLLEQLTSIEYKRINFKLSLLGSFEVVKAYNNLMDFASLSRDMNQKDDDKIVLMLYATLLLKIRKDLGDKNTFLKRLNEKDMLKSMNITDIDTLDISQLKNRYRQIKYAQTKNKK